MAGSVEEKDTQRIKDWVTCKFQELSWQGAGVGGGGGEGNAQGW